MGAGEAAKLIPALPRCMAASPKASKPTIFWRRNAFSTRWDDVGAQLLRVRPLAAGLQGQARRLITCRQPVSRCDTPASWQHRTEGVGGTAGEIGRTLFAIHNY